MRHGHKQTTDRHRRSAMAATTCLPNETLDVAAPCAAKSQKNCVAPVWWPERRAQNPIPSRTRPLNTPAPMVLCLKTRESRSPPDPHNAVHQHSLTTITDPAPGHRARSRTGAAPDKPHRLGAGWSSPVARQAHNLKVTGSNPVPATIFDCDIPDAKAPGFFAFWAHRLAIVPEPQAVRPRRGAALMRTQ